MAKKIEKKTYSAFDTSKFLSNMGHEPVLYKTAEKAMPIKGVLRETLNMNNIPLGNVTCLIGGSDTGKTTTMLLFAMWCYHSDIMPVIVDMERKFPYMRAMEMGLPISPYKVDMTTGERVCEYGDKKWDDYVGEDYAVGYDCPFIVADVQYMRNFMEFNKKGHRKKIDYKGKLDWSYTDILDFFYELNELQKKDPVDMHFFIDSYDRMKGPIFFDAIKQKKQPDNRADTQAKNNNIQTFIDRCVKDSVYAHIPYTNGFTMIVNKYTVSAGSLDTAKPTGGDRRKHYTDTEIYHGGKAGSGIKKISLTYKGQDYLIGTEVTLEVMKNHGESPEGEPQFFTTHKGKVIFTKHGVIASTDAAKQEYKKEHLNLMENEGEFKYEAFKSEEGE